MKIAIIGTGIAGNVVAQRLSLEHDITVFEAGSHVGGHSNTITVPSPDGNVLLDTGFMVFNNKTYPNFIRLLDELGVASQASPMSFSVQGDAADLEYNGSSINSLFAQRRNLLRPSFYRMIADILRFNREALELLHASSVSLSLGDYLAQGAYSPQFIRHYLIPMGAAIWSAEPETMARMPARFFVRFFHNHGLLNIKDRPAWRVIKGGSQAYVSKLVAGHRERIRLNCPVHAISRQGNRVRLSFDGGHRESFDRAFVACHADQALDMLKDASPLEREVLGALPYQRNEVVVHSDESLMPGRRRAWAAWNYHIPSADSRGVAVTYHLNRLQSLSTGQQYFATLNSKQRIRPDKVIAKLDYEHPMFTAQSVAAQARKPEIDGANCIYYCGAYWRNGFHEDGVVSALDALASFKEREQDAQLHFQRAG